MSCDACYSHATMQNCSTCPVDKQEKRENTPVTQQFVKSHVEYKLMRYEEPTNKPVNPYLVGNDMAFDRDMLVSMSSKEIAALLRR